MREYRKAHGAEGFFLKCDIRKYFPSIDHDVLKRKLSRVFGEQEVYNLLCLIIDSYENSPGKGLPLGNQVSQWFALFYLDSIDRLIKEKLQIKYYSRYMDDFVLLHHDKEYLRHCLHEISLLCHDELGLELNEKTQIFPLKNGVDYLGWHFHMTGTGKVIRKLRGKKKKSIKKRFRKMAADYRAGTLDFDAAKQCLASTYAHLRHGDTWHLRSKLARETVFTHGDAALGELKSAEEAH